MCVYSVDQITRFASDCVNEAALTRDERLSSALHEAARAALNFAQAVQKVDELRGEPFS
jgi:hypothetical protein